MRINKWVMIPLAVAALYIISPIDLLPGLPIDDVIVGMTNLGLAYFASVWT